MLVVTATAVTFRTTSPAFTTTSSRCPTLNSFPFPSFNASPKPSSLVGTIPGDYHQCFLIVCGSYIGGQLVRFMDWVKVFGLNKDCSIGVCVIQALLECGDVQQAMQHYIVYEAHIDRPMAEQILHCLMKNGAPKSTASKDVLFF